ncbi:DnaA/Hda family protein [bacterium]|nr:DnaA/Hda family protein [bacterium]
MLDVESLAMTNDPKRSVSSVMASGEGVPRGDSQQIGLSIRPKLRYDPKKFVLHSGVKGLLETLFEFLASPRYPVVSVVGEKRSGKTHTSYFLFDELQQRFSGYLVRRFDGGCFRNWLETEEFTECLRTPCLLLIDEADVFLDGFPTGNSGALVRIIEELRATQSALLFFRTRPSLEAYSFDEHLRTRFRAGVEFCIDHPGREDLLPVVNALAAQRGYRFPQRKLQYLEKRVALSLAEIESYLERLHLLTRYRNQKIDFSLLDDALA